MTTWTSTAPRRFINVGNPGVSQIWIDVAQIESVVTYKSGQVATGSVVRTTSGAEHFSVLTPGKIMGLIADKKADS